MGEAVGFLGEFGLSGFYACTGGAVLVMEPLAKGSSVEASDEPAEAGMRRRVGRIVSSMVSPQKTFKTRPKHLQHRSKLLP